MPVRIPSPLESRTLRGLAFSSLDVVEGIPARTDQRLHARRFAVWRGAGLACGAIIFAMIPFVARASRDVPRVEG